MNPIWILKSIIMHENIISISGLMIDYIQTLLIQKLVLIIL